MPLLPSACGQTFVEANILYGTILYMGREDGEALRALTRAHELKPDDSSVRSLLADELAIAAEQRAVNHECREAADLLKKALDLQPDSLDVSARLAQSKTRCPGN